jgi:hypothetical protein
VLNFSRRSKPKNGIKSRPRESERERKERVWCRERGGGVCDRERVREKKVLVQGQRREGESERARERDEREKSGVGSEERDLQTSLSL